MKRFLGILLAVVALSVAMVSCRKVVRADVRALVDEINDTVMVCKIGDSKVKFDIREAKFTHGAVMYGDSVVVNYIGDLSEKRAFCESVYLLDRPSNIIEIDRSKPVDPKAEPQTRPADAKADAQKHQKSMDMIKAAKRYANQK
jgi:hypothetical protein